MRQIKRAVQYVKMKLAKEFIILCVRCYTVLLNDELPLTAPIFNTAVTKLSILSCILQLATLQLQLATLNLEQGN